MLDAPQTMPMECEEWLAHFGMVKKIGGKVGEAAKAAAKAMHTHGIKVEEVAYQATILTGEHLKLWFTR